MKKIKMNAPRSFLAARDAYRSYVLIEGVNVSEREICFGNEEYT